MLASTTIETTMTTADRTTAADYAARIKANGEAYHAREIDYDEFTRVAFATWDEIIKRGEMLDAKVRRILFAREAR